MKTARLPRTSDYCSCALLGQNILITGYHLLKVCVYCPYLNSHSEYLEVTGDTHKLICSGSERAYLIEFGAHIYESAPNNPASWERIASDLTLKASFIGYRVYHNQKIYFMNYFCHLFSFDLERKKVYLVKKLKDSQTGN